MLDKQVIIKEYTDECQEEMIGLILQIQQQEYGIPITLEDQPDLGMVKDVYRMGRGNFWVALYEGHVVGTIALLDIGEGQSALRKMFVNAAFRGKERGTAGKLLEQALAWAKESGTSDIYLGTTPQFIAAHRFYDKNGFRRIHREELPTGFPVLAVDKLFYRYTL